MNERIRELAKEAYMWSVNEAKGDRNGCIVGSDYFLAMEKEKFAKLIVKECMDAVSNDPMALPYIQRIKAKFGVEYYEPIEKAFGGKE